MEKSPAMHLVSIVAKYRENERRHIPHSKVTDYLQSALELAIRTGLRFDANDFKTLGNSGQFYSLNWVYSLAVETNNISACQSFEELKGIKPFMLNGKRIYVGREFQFYNRKVRCTSFAKDGSYIIACSYRKLPEDLPKKIERIYKIRRHELKLLNSEKLIF